MKRLKLLLPVLLVTLFFCRHAYAFEDADIAGPWYLQEVQESGITIKASLLGYKQSLIFQQDHSVLTNDFEGSRKGTWEIAGDGLQIQVSDETLTYRYEEGILQTTDAGIIFFFKRFLPGSAGADGTVTDPVLTDTGVRIRSESPVWTTEDYAAAGIKAPDPESQAADRKYKVFTDGELQGIKDADDNIVLGAAYKEIDIGYYGSQAILSDGVHYGLFDCSTGWMILPVKYDEIVRPSWGGSSLGNNSLLCHSYYTVIADGKLMFLGPDGMSGFNTDIPAGNLTIRGASAYWADEEGIFHVIAADGVETVLPEDYEGIWALQRSNGRLYAARRASDHTSVVMDWHGNVLTGQGRALNPEISADGKYLRIYTGNGSYGIFKIA